MIINLEAELLGAHHDAAVAPPGHQAPGSENIFWDIPIRGFTVGGGSVRTSNCGRVYETFNNIF